MKQGFDCGNNHDWRGEIALKSNSGARLAVFSMPCGWTGRSRGQPIPACKLSCRAPRAASIRPRLSIAENALRQLSPPSNVAIDNF